MFMQKLLQFSLCAYTAAAVLLLAGGALLLALCRGWLCVCGILAALAGGGACAAAISAFLTLSAQKNAA